MRRKKELFSLIKDLGKVVRRFQNDAVFYADVTFTQFCILDIVADRGVTGLSELHPLLGVEKSTTTRLIEPLVSRGLLDRVQSHHDSRAVELRLTRSGKDVHERVGECVMDFLDTILKQIPDRSAGEVLGSLRLFTKALGECQGECSGS